jgi:hypothetical protein
MPLGTSWRDIGSLLWYGLICVGAFFGTALLHWFVIPYLPIPSTAKTALDYFLIVPLGVVVHLVWGLAFKKAAPSPYRRSRRSARSQRSAQ